MYDSNGNLKPGYTNERSVPYKLLDLRSSTIKANALRTHLEAADHNHSLRTSNLRWIPA